MKNTTPILGLFFCATVAFWAFCLLRVAVSSLPYNPISLSKKSRTNLAVLIPEGWAFFTRDPRESSVLIYQEQQGTIQVAMPPNSSSRNLFGAIRRSRAMGIEMGAISTQIADDQWLVSDRSLANCPQLGELPVVNVINRAYQPKFCGTYFLTLEEPIPWAWASSFSTIEMPCKIVKINSLCLS